GSHERARDDGRHGCHEVLALVSGRDHPLSGTKETWSAPGPLATVSPPQAPRSSGSTVDVARRPGYPWPEQMGRNLSRKVRETRSSSRQKRSQPAAHPCRGPGGQAGDEHGGPPWFEGACRRGHPLCGTNLSLCKIHFH